MDPVLRKDRDIFSNNDQRLREQAARVLEDREALGLAGLTGDLAFCIIGTEVDTQQAAVAELIQYTGYDLDDAFETDEARTCVLKRPNSADILVRSRLKDDNPFRTLNCRRKSAHLPNTRLETLVFSCADIDRYYKIQNMRGVQFMTDGPVDAGNHRFVQTNPSTFTGNSIGLVQWDQDAGRYRTPDARELNWDIQKGERPWLNTIGVLDHIATRVKAEHRDPAILEFMGLTDYHFAFAIYVPELNSITNVSRLDGGRFALVFTSGIVVNPVLEAMGPTELFVENYGARAHHMAFITGDIEATHAALSEDGLDFLSELVGCEQDGIKQSFSTPSPNTLLVNEYIQRYGGFDGFFTQHNVTQLTLATLNQ